MIRVFERTAVTQHQFPSIGADSTGGGVLTIVDTSAGEKNSFSGILKEVKVACDSTNFEVIIKASKGAPSNSIHKVYSKASGNLFIHETGLANSWINRNNPQVSELYLTLINGDGVNPTGEITVQLTNDIQKRWTSGK